MPGPASATSSEQHLSPRALRPLCLRGANLADARLGPAAPGNELKTPQQTDLSGALLVRASLRNADLSRVNLAFADLSGADLTDAIPAGADLSRAVLRGANLSGANLEDADLNGADFAGAQGISGARALEKARNRDNATF